MSETSFWPTSGISFHCFSLWNISPGLLRFIQVPSCMWQIHSASVTTTPFIMHYIISSPIGIFSFSHSNKQSLSSELQNWTRNAGVATDIMSSTAEWKSSYPEQIKKTMMCAIRKQFRMQHLLNQWKKTSTVLRMLETLMTEGAILTSSWNILGWCQDLSCPQPTLEGRLDKSLGVPLHGHYYAWGSLHPLPSLP